jgi:dTDP-D-glucose 4,6-dehydratase
MKSIALATHMLSIEKAANAFHWQPKKSNAQALIETYEWYCKHWQEYRHRQGLTSHEPWKQGILKVVKWLS